MAYAPHHTGSGWQIRSITRPLARIATHLQREWRHRRTEKMLESLPAEIRKDIGWPTSDDTDASGRIRH